MSSSMRVQHWASALELVGEASPSTDGVPTTSAGEPLDSAAKVREFIADLNRARTA